MTDPKDKKKLLEENPLLNADEADLLDDDLYIDMIIEVFESADNNDDDDQIYEDSVLAEFGYIDAEGD